MRTITHSDHINGAGEAVYVSTVHYASAAERKAGDAACQRVVVAQAFTPFGHAGEPQDPPEEWPSDKTAAWVGPPNCLDGGEYRAALQFESAAGDLNPDACKSGVCTTE
jgi:hypothetical protein